MRIISVRQEPGFTARAISYFQQSWPEIDPKIYEDCISNSLHGRLFLPQWYLLEKEGQIIGCAGLITNDFISRGDLYPWVCALFIDEEHRGNGYGALLLRKAEEDTKEAGFGHLYLCTDHTGYYEKYGFSYIGDGYHPWGESSRIYEISL